VQYFDVLVGFFFSTCFHLLHRSLEKAEKIRILVGIGTDKSTIGLLKQVRAEQQLFQFSHAEVKEEFTTNIKKEMGYSQDGKQIEEGVYKFIEWLKSGKLEIRAYPTENIHAKLYIMTFPKSHYDIGRVITDKFALQKFNELWENSVDVKDQYIETIREKTWLNNTIKPYELYLKFLFEYFKSELNQPEDIFFRYVPSDFIRFEYQEQAVLNAKKIIEEYGGVFISDVVGLGKTYTLTLINPTTLYLK